MEFAVAVALILCNTLNEMEEQRLISDASSGFQSIVILAID